jgi:hypothetical protein
VRPFAPALTPLQSSYLRLPHKQDCLYNFVRAGLRLCACFTQSFRVIAIARACSTFINSDNRSAL